jgi:hypothetical protein
MPPCTKAISTPPLFGPQELYILHGARRISDFEGDAVPGQNLPVALGESVVSARLVPRSDGDGSGRRGFHELVSNDKPQNRDDNSRSQNPEMIF